MLRSADEARQLTDKANEIVEILKDLDNCIRIAAEKGHSEFRSFQYARKLGKVQKEKVIGALQLVGYKARWNLQINPNDPEELVVSWVVEPRNVPR